MAYEALHAQKVITLGIGKKLGTPPYLITGTVSSIATGDELANANIFIERQNIGTSADENGEFKLELYKGTYILKVSSIGYLSQSKTINVQGPGNVNFTLEENITELDEVVFQAEGADQNITSKEIGKNVLTVESIKTLPPLAGEVDVLKSLTLLPGFSAGGPIVKDKLSVMTAGRWSYPNWLIRQTDDPNIANSTASFFDANIILNYIINEKNDLEYSFYVSGDEFQFANNIANEWQNLAQ
ncbi:TonB-dependent receptor, partial [Durusdinium trenchii]